MPPLPPTEEATALEIEERIIGITHAEVGYLVGEHWLLPSELTRAVRYHHVPELELESKGFAPVVFLANKFCTLNSSTLAQPMTFDERTSGLLKHVGLSEASFQNVLRSFAKVADDIDVF